MGNAGPIRAIALLVLVFAAAVALGLLVHRLEERRGLLDNRDGRGVSGGVGGAVGFIGGAAAFLLGVLMLSSVDHYNATDDIATEESLHYSAAFDGAAGLPPTDRAKIQRDLVCLMRSTATKSWTATRVQDMSGSENSHAWRARALNDANTVVPTTKVQENSLSAVHSELLAASQAGQQRLLSAASKLPTALWVLVYVSIFALTFCTTVLVRPYPILAVSMLAAVLLLNVAMVWTLTLFAEPFSQHDGVYIAPRALDSVMVRLQGTYPGPAWEPCEELAAS